MRGSCSLSFFLQRERERIFEGGESAGGRAEETGVRMVLRSFSGCYGNGDFSGALCAVVLEMCEVRNKM